MIAGIFYSGTAEFFSGYTAYILILYRQRVRIVIKLCNLSGNKHQVPLLNIKKI